MIKSKGTTINFIFCSMLCTPWVQADEEKTETTLCNIGEKIYFSCPFSDEKIVSICASVTSVLILDTFSIDMALQTILR